jgi:hypothetical protein
MCQMPVVYSTRKVRVEPQVEPIRIFPTHDDNVLANISNFNFRTIGLPGYYDIRYDSFECRN